MPTRSFRISICSAVLALLVSGCGITGSDSDKIVVLTDDQASVVSARLIFRFDSSKSPAGTGWMVARILAGPFSDVAEKRLAQLSDLGAKIHAHTGREALFVDVDCPKSAWGELAPILAQHLAPPTFENVKLDELRLIQHAALDSLRHDADALCRAVFWGSAYDGTANAIGPIGTDSSIEAITTDNLRSFGEEFVTKENFFLGLAGPVSASDAAAFCAQLRKVLPDGKIVAPAPVPARPTGLNVRIIQSKGLAGATVLIGATSSTLSADSSASVLAAAVSIETSAGASLTGMDQSLRLERGMVTELDGATSLIASTDGGVRRQSDDPQIHDFLCVTAQTDQINALYVIKIILKELSDINSVGISPSEMEAMNGRLQVASSSLDVKSRMEEELAMSWMGIKPGDRKNPEATPEMANSHLRNMVHSAFDPKDMWIIVLVPDAQQFEADVLGGMTSYHYPDWVDRVQIRRLDLEYVSFRPFWQADKIRTTSVEELFR